MSHHIMTSSHYICPALNDSKIKSCVWGNENPHDVTERKYDIPKVSVSCTLMKGLMFLSFLKNL
jgi:hypothetical protein